MEEEVTTKLDPLSTIFWLLQPLICDLLSSSNEMWHWKQFPRQSRCFSFTFCQGVNWQSWGWACIQRLNNYLPFRCFFFFFTAYLKVPFRCDATRFLSGRGHTRRKNFFSPDKKKTTKVKVSFCSITEVWQSLLNSNRWICSKTCVFMSEGQDVDWILSPRGILSKVWDFSVSPFKKLNTMEGHCLC